MSYLSSGTRSDAGMTIDELAAATGTTTRRIRSFQTLGLLPHPELRGRTGLYGAPHRDRLAAILAAPGRGVLPRIARASSSTPSTPAGPSPRCSVSPNPRPGEPTGRSRRRARHGHRRALRLRRAAALPPSDAGAGRCCRSCPPPCGTRARRPSVPPGGPSRRVRRLPRCSVGSRAVPDPSRPLRCPLGRGGAIRGRRRRDHPPRRRVAARPTTRSTSGCTWATGPTTWRPTGPGRRRPSASTSTPWSSPARSTAPTAVLVGPEDCGPRRRHGGRRRPRHRHPRDDVARRHPGRSSSPTASRSPWSTRPRGVLAAVHAGWRGTAAGAVARGAGRHGGPRCPARAGAWPSSGPAVASGRATRSPTRCRARWPSAVRPAPLDPAVARPDGPGHWLVDLAAANRQQLLDGRRPRRAHLRAAAPRRTTTPTSRDRAQRPCGRFALLARLSD